MRTWWMALLILAACGGPSEEGFLEHTPAERGCSVIEQDCGDDEKCTIDLVNVYEVDPWTSVEYPRSYMPATCKPVKGRGDYHDACTLDPDTGEDDCREGLACFTTTGDRTMGQCLPICDSAADSCAEVGYPELSCRRSTRVAPGWCMADCDPRDGDRCDGGTTCSLWERYPEPQRSPACVPMGPARYGETCGNAMCGRYMVCARGVCTAFCALDDPQNCPSGRCESRAYAKDLWYDVGLCYVEQEEE